jgi:hypothetical protein
VTRAAFTITAIALFAVRQLQHHRLSPLNRHANVETLMGKAGGQ